MKTTAASRQLKVFRNGNSVAVRLPKSWGVKAGSQLQGRRSGKRIILQTHQGKPKTLAEMMAWMRSLGPDPGPFDRRQPPAQKRDFLKD